MSRQHTSKWSLANTISTEAFASKKTRNDNNPALPMVNVWDDPMITKLPDYNGWDCGYCGSHWGGRPAPARVLQHIMPLTSTKKGMKPCSFTLHSLTADRLSLWQNYAAKNQCITDTRNNSKSLASMQYHNSNMRMTSTLANDSQTSDEIASDTIVEQTPSTPNVRSNLYTTELGGRIYHQPTMRESARKSKDHQDRKLQVAIAQFVHGLGLPFNTGNSELFRNVLEIAKTVKGKFVLPSRNQMATQFLNMVCDDHMKDITAIIDKDKVMYGLTLIMDGATIDKLPLVDILVASPSLPVTLLDIVDCTQHLQGKTILAEETNGLGSSNLEIINDNELRTKNGKYLSGILDQKIQELDPSGLYVDLIAVDGAGDMQKCGALVSCKHPRVQTIWCHFHQCNKVFEQVQALAPIAAIRKGYNVIYCLFGSGIYHYPYALFTRTKQQHNLDHLMLQKPSGTRAADLFLCLYKLLRLKAPLVQLITMKDFQLMDVRQSWLKNA